MDMVRVALLGAGMMAETHAKVYIAMEDISLKYIYNRSGARGRALAERFSAQYTADLDEVFRDPEVDVIDICLPTYLHEEMLMKASEARKHILCEKPFALNLEQGIRMIETIRKSGVKLMVAHVLRFWPEYMVIHDVVKEGRIGEPLFARATRVGERPVWNEWCKDPGLSGGAILDLQIHDLDLLTWMFGKPDKLYARGMKSEQGAWDHVMTTLSYGSGLQVFCESGVMMPEGYPFTMDLRVTGTEGSVEFNFKASKGNVEERNFAEQSAVLYKPGRQPEVLKIPEGDGYENEIRYFIDAVVSGSHIDRVTEEEVLSVLKLVEKSKESLENGTIVDFKL